MAASFPLHTSKPPSVYGPLRAPSRPRHSAGAACAAGCHPGASSYNDTAPHRGFRKRRRQIPGDGLLHLMFAEMA
jgi:hypothetical protein